MKMLILSEEQRARIEEINASGDLRNQLGPVALQDGTYALNADVLSEIGPGRIYEAYGEVLREAPLATVAQEDFVPAAELVKSPERVTQVVAYGSPEDAMPEKREERVAELTAARVEFAEVKAAKLGQLEKAQPAQPVEVVKNG